MSQLLREEVAQRNLSTIDVATYLRTRGWERLEHPSRDVSYWRRVIEVERFEVLLPHHHDWSDHLDLLTALVDTVARAERRSALSLLHDLSTATSDVIRLRAVAGPSSDGTIGVGDGLRLVDCLRRVALAAACTAVEPRRAYHKRKFTEATRFVDRLRLGQTERGSFVLTALSSVTPALTEDPAGQEPDPFERKVTRTLAQALSGLEAAALQGILENQIDPFEREVERGVSADLCEAIALLGESEVIEQIDFEIAWSPVRPAPLVARRASFTKAVFPVIRSAGASFRERTPVEEFELEGITTHITRPGEARRGEAKILAVIDGRQRLITVVVEGQDWEIASKSMTERVLLRCDGELRRIGSAFFLEHPRNFRLAAG
jgi:hypothetical protein